MTTYYRSSAVVVTTQEFQRGWPDPERFQVRELRDVKVTVGRPQGTGMRAVAGAGALVVGATAGWPLVEGNAAWLTAAMLVAAAPSAMCGACLRRRQQVWELRASYRDKPVLLLRTQDERTFGQVKRALVRALEANRN